MPLQKAKPWLNKIKLKSFSAFSPKLAGQFATKLFVESRNAANPHKQAFTPIGAKAISIETAGSKVKNLYLWGDVGEIVLLVHGWGAECGSMFGFVSELTKKGYRVATFDGPAHGSSEGEFSTMNEYVQETQRVIEKLGEVTRVIAHSLGGIVALAAIAKNPRIKQVTLISTPYSLLDVLNIWSKSFMEIKEPVRQEILKQLLKDNGVPVSHWDVGLHASHQEAPILIIHANDDGIVSVNHANRIEQAVPQSQVQILEQLGHIRILSSRTTHQLVADFFK